MSVTSEAEKYEAWAGELKQQLETYEKLRRQVRYFPLFALLTSPLGFLRSPQAAFVICLAWMSLWATTLYITYMRTWQYRTELRKTNQEVLRLHELEDEGG